MRTCSALLLICCLSACQLMPQSVRDAVAPETRQDLSEQLRRAEQALANDPNNAALKTELAALQQQAAALEADHLSRAEQLWDKKQWGAALNQLDAGLLTLPDSTALQRRRTYYLELLDRRLTLPREELKLVRGRFVADALRVHRQTNSYAPDLLGEPGDLSALEKEREQLGQEILAIAQRAIERKHTGFARWALNIAQDLEVPEAKRWQTELAKLEGSKQRKTAVVTEVEASEQQVLEEHRLGLKRAVQQALQQKDVNRLLASLKEWRKLFPGDADIALAKSQAQPLIDSEVVRLNAEASQRYREGDISGAIQRWQRVLALQPDNKDVPPLIERAQRVQANLETLKK
ncbi:hypothetical protein EV696_1135 [Permianibacter aggregans]|uniref:Tetratricopeptide repeat protein n=2 Tax=Permianibacter aggregans TaxID=1510150 RepID=A0A4R6USU8_9GAMM|nr:hypothetical protein EV696_1135 [Permianibacter aggregans]